MRHAGTVQSQDRLAKTPRGTDVASINPLITSPTSDVTAAPKVATDFASANEVVTSAE